MVVVGGHFICHVPLQPFKKAARALQYAAGARTLTTTRVNVCPLLSDAPRGEFELHALDASNLRRGIGGAWRFESLLDLDAMGAALLCAVARYPPVAGWVGRAARPGGGLAVKWDAHKAGRGVSWAAASCRGAPPAVDDDEGIYERGFMPNTQRHCLLALQATHFPDAGCTLLVAVIDHVVADFQSFTDFLTAWCNECSAEAAAKGARPAPATPPVPPAPVWDRALLLPRRGDASADGSEAGGAAGASSWGGSSSGGASSRSWGSSSADSGGSCGSTASAASSAAVGGRAYSRDRAFWPGAGADGAADDAPVWHTECLSRIESLRVAGAGLASLISCETRHWVLPRAAIAQLKRSLGTAMPPDAAPTANDVLSALLAAGVAWADPARVAARGGMNVHVVVNGRGRFGQATGRDYFGTDSLLVPVWVPSFLLPPAGAPSPLPSPALVAHIHTALREMLSDPAGLMRRRYEWMAAAQAAGKAGDVRHCEGAALLDGDVCVDNVSNYGLYDLRFGGTGAPSAVHTRFTVCPRLAWVSTAAPPAAGAAGGAGGGLRVAMPLPLPEWQALSPHWAALGLELVKAYSSTDQAGYHPASIRNQLSEVTRSALMGL